MKIFFFCNPPLVLSEISEEKNNLTFSFFGETGETESAFTIAGRNFPVKVGSVGLKATTSLQTIELYSRAGIGYSQKQTVVLSILM